MKKRRRTLSAGAGPAPRLCQVFIPMWWWYPPADTKSALGIRATMSKPRSPW